ncbi:NAD-dependent epimerase/dehydratase family protein [Phytomonospora endophytica]|uniref:Nucleoside-diphosphate-sugar epimerase n=1 Tax=Phytomonospora endophytica TaxID=714109 RepID=A0A841FF50_9ACTN|nr:NAD-dependent epimerase/dehydratase family protein [Phytomonospora endophytica]MBB6032468.1 nucleoside-diphosphate-sugar epimerase [Phytomonospora endophytica]GIG66384.1 reductase [Phytomonospora endophytica]
MTRTAFVLGATGQIGHAAITALLADGWDVTAASRGRSANTIPDGARPITVDRSDPAALDAAVGTGYDVLVDTIAFTAAHGRELRAFAGRVGSAVVISTGAVYTDTDGNALGDDPLFPAAIPETQPTSDPTLGGYGPDKVALENELLAAGSELPTTLLRAGTIHGRNSAIPREWYFVKRALDRRPVRILAHPDAVFHPVAAVNLAELIRLAAHRPGSRVLNAGDPTPPTAAEIGTAIGAAMNHLPEEIHLDGPPIGNIGDSPWSLPGSFVMDMGKAARELGYEPVTDYAGALPDTIAWLTEVTAGRDWREVLPGTKLLGGADMFDYDAEDAWLAERR